VYLTYVVSSKGVIVRGFSCMRLYRRCGGFRDNTRVRSTGSPSDILSDWPHHTNLTVRGSLES